MKMDKKNLLIFLVILSILMAFSYMNMLGSGSIPLNKGTPVIRDAFLDTDYEFSIGEDEVIVVFAEDIANEYEGRFLSVYAYDSNGNHVTKMKRVVNGEIIIDKTEIPSFVVSFDAHIVTDVGKADQSLRFLSIIKDAKENERNFGVERCLLGERCIAICPVAAVTVLIRDDENKGRIIPDIDYETCILDGLCASRCPTNLITT